MSGIKKSKFSKTKWFGVEEVRKRDLEKYPVPPRIEVVDKYEVYLLDSKGNRVKRICGKKRRGYPDGYVCLNYAGMGTIHKGIGYCSNHDPRSGRKLYMEMEEINKKLATKGKKLFPTVKEGMELAEIINDDMNDLSMQVKIIMGLLMAELTKEDVTLDNASIYKIIDLVREVRNLKESHYKIKKDSALDLRVISAFIDKIFSVIAANAELVVARSIMEKIRTDVIIPITSIEGKEGKKLEVGVRKSLDVVSSEKAFDKNEIENGKFTEKES